jgi:hypothetical protein
VSDTPETDAAAHNIGSFQQPHYVVDVEIAQDLERRLIAAAAENVALQQLINDVANKINGKAPIVHVASWGKELLNRINAARKE